MRTRTVLLSIALATIGLAYGGQRNENSRISVKHATDDGAAHIARRAQTTTVEDMLNQVRPEGLDSTIQGQGYQTTRAGTFESTKWVVEATITQIILRPDGDFYCVIEGKSGARTVIEAPDPELCAGSHFLNEIKKVRKMLDDKFHPTPQPVNVNIKVRLTGLGFFGFQGRSPSGGKTNGARLMPVLDVRVMK